MKVEIEWIKTSERLPDNDEIKLVTCETKKEVIRLYNQIFEITSGHLDDWRLEIVVDRFFPCKQSRLLKLIKIIKSGSCFEFEEKGALTLLYKYLLELSIDGLILDQERRQLDKNMELLVKTIKEYN